MKLPNEIEEGNIEYKLKIIPEKLNRLVSLSSQLIWRCNEGRGMAIYFLGITDNGEMIGITKKELDISIRNLSKIVSENSYQILKKEIYRLNTDKLWANIIIINPSYSPIFNNISLLD